MHTVMIRFFTVFIHGLRLRLAPDKLFSETT